MLVITHKDYSYLASVAHVLQNNTQFLFKMCQGITGEHECDYKRNCKQYHM